MLKPPTINYIRLVAVLFVFSFIISCSNRPKGVLSQDEMTNFLVDLHTLDGMLLVNGLGNTDNIKNIFYYNNLLNKYNITKEDFDSSLVWYTKNASRFEKIYKKVVIQLTENDSLIKTAKLHHDDSIAHTYHKINIWDKPIKYHFTKDSTRTHLNFSIKNQGFQVFDKYILKLLHGIAPSDSSKNPKIIFRIHYASGWVDSIYYSTKNDNNIYRYTLKLTADTILKVDSLSVSLLASDRYKGKPFAKIDSISLTREFCPALQDSLQNLLNNSQLNSKLITDTISNRFRIRNAILKNFSRKLNKKK